MLSYQNTNVKGGIKMELIQKKCIKCKKTKEESRFPLNSTTQDGLHYYCKRCSAEITRKSKGLDEVLTTLELSILLKYLPYAHEKTNILARKPAGKGKDDSIPLTLTDISRDNDITFQQIQQMFYKFTRLELTTMIVQSDNDGVIDTIDFYKKDTNRKIKERR